MVGAWRERGRHKGNVDRVLELMLLTEMLQLAYLASDLMRLLFLFLLNSEENVNYYFVFHPVLGCPIL